MQGGGASRKCDAGGGVRMKCEEGQKHRADDQYFDLHTQLACMQRIWLRTRIWHSTLLALAPVYTTPHGLDCTIKGGGGGQDFKLDD